MPVPLLDLKRQYAYLKDDMNKAVLDVLEHGWFILGPEVKKLEEDVASLCQVPLARGVASGTDALLLALFAAGIKPGDEVITTDFSFFATAGIIIRLGAKPVFIDIEEDSYNIDPTLVEAAITEKTKAIIPVHLYGQLADMDPIMKIAEKHDLIVIEDAAQAIGAEYKGKRAGSIGHYGCFSFYPTKNLGAGGDGGMIVSRDAENEKMLTIIRNHGADPKYYHKIVGFNSRLASIQAAILNTKLPYLRQWSEKRIEHAEFYNKAFETSSNIRTPKTMPYSDFHIYNQYTLSVPNRDDLAAGLKEKGIGFEIYYPVPFHQQECFAFLNPDKEKFPVSAKAAREVISLPIYPEMTEEELNEVSEAVISLCS